MKIKSLIRVRRRANAIIEAGARDALSDIKHAGSGARGDAARAALREHAAFVEEHLLSAGVNSAMNHAHDHEIVVEIGAALSAICASMLGMIVLKQLGCRVIFVCPRVVPDELIG